MIYAKYLSVDIFVTLAPNIVVVRRKNHDIAMGRSGINNILRSAHIVRRIVEPSSVVVIHAIVLQNDRIDIGFFSSTRKISRLIESAQYVSLQFWHEILLGYEKSVRNV